MSTESYQGAAQALADARAMLEMMPASEVQTLRVSVPRAVSLGLKNARSFSEDRPRFEATFKKAAFDPAAFDDLTQRALALWAADVELRMVLDPASTLSTLLTEASPLRKRMLRAAEYLWGEDEEFGPQVAAIRQGNGHMDTADDLNALAALFDAQWAWAASRSAVTREDIDAARRLSLELMSALTGSASDEARAREISATRDLRERAWTWLLLGTNEVRAAAAFLFRDQPERLADYPSLHARPNARSRTRNPSPSTEPPPTDLAVSAEA